ncbi:MAG: magnesium transporter MgtE N-terminal domain-containing protein [Acidimicrobiales bacterium]
MFGRIEDVVLAPAAGSTPPRVLGVVANVQRRRIFVNAGRAAEVGRDGVRLRGGTVDLRHFKVRPGELLLSGLLGKQVGSEILTDVAFEPAPSARFDVVAVAFGGRGLHRRTRRVAPWSEARSLFEGGPLAAELAVLRDMSPTDVAARVHAMPPHRRAMLAGAIPDEQLADVLEELPEEEQVRLLASMDLARVADVVGEMEPDDASDLLGAMTRERRDGLLAQMDPEDAEALRRLLRYDPATAGGLMTSEPVIVGPDVPVAEVLARLRDDEVRPTLAAQAFVCESPTATPTGPYHGVVGFQRLLREPPSNPVGRCVDDRSAIAPDLAEHEVAVRLAAYNLTAVAVCDAAGRLVGAVTVDDVLERLLPVDWRERRR